VSRLPESYFRQQHPLSSVFRWRGSPIAQSSITPSMATESTLRPVVLFVDDRDSRPIYREYLQSMGCRVIAAHDGSAAVDQAVRDRPDVIVIDFGMAQMDGPTMIRRLRLQEPTRRVAIIALTAMPAARDSAREAGCDAFLAKPCLPELLWWEVRSLLTRMPSGRPLWPRETAGDSDVRRP